jgi:HlyD family secretion protein
MNRASPTNSNRKFWLIASVLLLVAAVAGTIYWLSLRQAAEIGYETAVATRGTLTANVGATGSIRAGHSVVLVWKTTGRVESVQASIGQKVQADQILAKLAPDSVARNVILAQADMLTAQQNLDNVLKSNINLAQAMQNQADARQTLQDAQDAYDTITRIRVSQELIQDTSDQIDQANAQLKRMEYFFDRFFSHRIDGATNKSTMILTLTRLRQNVTDLTAKYNWYTSRASATEIEQSLAALNLAKAQEGDAQRELERVKNGKNQDDIKAAKARLAAAVATTDMAKIIAPFDGSITQAHPLSGDRVTSGQTAFQVDDLSELMVDLQISEVDINNVIVGQSVTINMDAIPNVVYNGIVSKVNQSAKAGQGGINFLVSIKLTDANELVKPGMSAAVTIAVKEVESALLVPNKAVRMMNGQRFVYVLKDKQAVPVSIRIGTSADETSQVVGGDLKEGDLIILNPPSTASATPGA